MGDATSVSRTTAPDAGSAKVCVPRLGHKGEELIEFRIAVERIVCEARPPK
jgi:hypothetical protein